jgi:hypothetical protein
MYPKLTYSLLVEKKACQDQLDLVAKHFGKTKAIPLTKSIVTKFASLFDIEWAAQNLLTKKDFEKYDKAIEPHFSKYKIVTDPAWEEFNKEVNVQVSRRWAKYNKVSVSALAEYDKAIALEFVRLYKKGMKK